FIGGYSAIVDKDATTADKLLIDSIPQALAQTEYVCSSVSIGSSRSGINMSAVAKMGQVVKQAAEETADRSAIGAAIVDDEDRGARKGRGHARQDGFDVGRLVVGGEHHEWLCRGRA
ncbi:DUF711 family protein, partial [Klebsiella pneumoniae]